MRQLDIFSLVGRVAIVAGGGGGIGSSLAEALAGAGAKVAVAGRTRESCEATLERVRAAGSEGLAITADMTSEADCERMIEEGRDGRILNISSVRASLGINAGYSAYVAAKGAINSLTRQWATEWARYGIRVNAIMPTFVDTPQVAMLLEDPAFKAGIVGRIQLGRVGETRDIVGPAIFLCSDAASFVTGQVLGIDGGLTATQ